MPLVDDVPHNKYTYTVIVLEKDVYDEIVDSDVDDGTDEWIHAFIHDGKFSLPYTLGCPPGHWSDEIIAAHPGEYMIVIKGSPERVDVTLERYMITGELNRILKLSKVEEDTPTVLLKLCKAMDRNVYHNHYAYKTWETSVGYVAVCDK
jgi:hypothetical protein